MRITKMKGTLDFIGSEAAKYLYLEEVAKQVCYEFGFEPIITPIFEATELFKRGVGEETDIVNKEMYTFIDKGERSITLRPEGTASVTRSYVENKLYAIPGLKKYFYFGPMFRYERPQTGRTRQFTQFGVEALGASSSYLDADIINMAYTFLSKIGISKVKVLINTIGSKEGRTKYEKSLKEYFKPYLDQMCDDCKVRFEKNPLRILDCKIDSKQTFFQGVPKIIEFLSEEDKNYFYKILSILDEFNIKYEVSDTLVRGLDYYTNDVFEFVYDDENSPLNGITLLAGGRYNGLSSQLDGPDTEAIGFACGVERLMLALDEIQATKSFETKADAIIITIGENTKATGISFANELRKLGKYVEIDYVNHNLKPQFKLAERTKARYIIIMGEDEINSACYQVKDTVNNTETKLTKAEIVNLFK